MNENSFTLKEELSYDKSQKCYGNYRDAITGEKEWVRYAYIKKKVEVNLHQGS